MTLHPPLQITPRLMAGVRVGSGEQTAWLSLGTGPRNREGHTQYGCWIDLPDGTEHEVTDLRSGCQGGGVQGGLASLLAFLGAAAESYRYRRCDWKAIGEDDNASLFPRAVTEWAYGVSDELASLQCELEEAGELVGGE